MLGFGIPLTADSFHRQEQNPNGGDFIRSQGLSWDKHQFLFVDSCLKVIPHLRKWGVRVVEELTLQALVDVFAQAPAATILFAHCRDSDGSVELADGLVSPEKFVSFVPSDFDRIIDLCVCQPVQLVPLLKQKCPHCLVKLIEANATPIVWLYIYEVMFKILTTKPDYFQAQADAFTYLTELQKP